MGEREGRLGEALRCSVGQRAGLDFSPDWILVLINKSSKSFKQGDDVI